MLKTINGLQSSSITKNVNGTRLNWVQKKLGFLQEMQPSCREVVKTSRATARDLLEKAWRETAGTNFATYRARDLYISSRINSSSIRPFLNVLMRSTERYYVQCSLNHLAISYGLSAEDFIQRCHRRQVVKNPVQRTPLMKPNPPRRSMVLPTRTSP